MISGVNFDRSLLILSVRVGSERPFLIELIDYLTFSVLYLTLLSLLSSSSTLTV